jgi:hypothetical protein
VFYEGYQVERRTPQALPTVRAAGTYDVPVVTRGDFYRAGLLALPEEVTRIGRVTGRESPNTIGGVLPPQIALYDGGGGGRRVRRVLPAAAAEWGTRPEIRVARVQVVRASARTSAVRVVSLEQPALERGLPVRLVGKMP